MKKVLIIMLFAVTGLSAGNSNHAVKPQATESEQLVKTIDDQTAKVDKLLIKLKSKR